MNNEAEISRIIELLQKHTSFSICIPLNPSIDTIAASVTLYLHLTKLGKQVNLTCGQDINAPSIIGEDKIQKDLAKGGDSLVVYFPYEDGAVDKVTYTIEGNYFNLVIQPGQSKKKLDPSAVKYSYTGGKLDALIVIDAPTLESLGEVYSAHHNEFKGKDIINIDRHMTNSQFGTVNLVNKSASSTSEIIFELLKLASIPLTPETATNLYAGIRGATNNFTSYAVNAGTFEAAAELLKSGATKRAPMAPMRPTSFPSPFSTPPSFTETPAASLDTIEAKEEKGEEETPEEWLKPKIFKGSSLI